MRLSDVSGELGHFKFPSLLERGLKGEATSAL